MSSISDIEQLCKKKLRLTKQLKVILHVIFNSSDHPTVDEIYIRARELSNSISKPTVYRSVKKLSDLEVIQKHDFGLGKAHYEIVTYHHHHIVNIVTGQVVEFTSEKLEILKNEIANNLGFKLIDHRLDLYGVPIQSLNKENKDEKD
jgi:Fur family ferric uptake transcriptional regulator